MELLCPNCQQKLTIPEQYAGQLMKCPLCGGTFTTPALPGGPGMGAPPPIPPSSIPPVPPPSPPNAPYGLAPAPAPPPSPPYYSATPPPPKPEPAPIEAPPPLPPGDYTRTWTICISPRVVPWVAPVGLVVLFLLSFFPWYMGINPWKIAFTGAPDAKYILYLVLVLFLGLPLSIVSLLIGLKIIPTPPALAALVPWRSLIVLGLMLLGFIALLVDYIHFNFTALNPITIWLKLAFRVHFIVVVFLLFEFWLELRRTRNLPPPKIEVRW